MCISQPIAKPPDEQKKQLWAVSEQNTLKIFNAFLCVAWLAYILKYRLSSKFKILKLKIILFWGVEVSDLVVFSLAVLLSKTGAFVVGACKYHKLQEN